MRRFAPLLSLGLASVALAGCPIWSGDANSDGYYTTTSSTGSNTCFSADDCPSGQTCGVDHVCIPFESTGGSGTGGSGTGASGTGGAGGASVIWCGNPADCAATETCGPDGTCEPGGCDVVGCVFGYLCDAGTNLCVPENPAACGADSDCAEFGTSFKCVSGVCTPPQDQCFDQTQCPSGDVCADGKCVPSCSGTDTCSGSYTCDSSLGLCTVPASACTITNDCGGPDAVCVDGACVPRSDGPLCPDGFVWAENGCIPNQSAFFVCSIDGMQDACAAGSICLHHSCYISCEPPNQNACSALPSFDQCKSVTTPSGSHQVCGSASNLGDECDPTAGVECQAGLVCIDGYCQ